MSDFVKRQAAALTALLLVAAISSALGEPAASPSATDRQLSESSDVAPKEAVCAVCGVREKAGPEPVQ